MLARVTDNTSICNLDKGDLLRKVTVKIGLERIDTQEGIMVEALLDSGVTGLVMSLEFARKQGFKLKKLDRPIYVRNMDGSLNKEEPIEHMVEVNIYYQVSRTKEVDLIFFISSFSFYFLFDLFSFILFLEPELGLE